MKKWQDQGFWKSKLFYWQSLFYYFFFSSKYRSFTWFSVVNPAFPFSGMLEDKKSDIHGFIPFKYRPEIFNFQSEDDIRFPVIVKPDVGLKGYLVTRVDDIESLSDILQNEKNIEWIVQEYIDLKCEYSILVYKVPGTKQKKIVSFTQKEYPSVLGNGKDSLRNLIDGFANPFLDRKQLYNTLKRDLDKIPESEELIVLHTIGNYSRGAKFISLQNNIDQELEKRIFELLENIEGMNFIRIDLKSNSLEDLKSGNFKIIEINGLKGEPIHIYDKNYPWRQTFTDIHQHWMIINKIVKVQLNRGLKFTPFFDTLSSLRSLRNKVEVSG